MGRDLSNAARNALKPGYARVMATKLGRRITTKRSVRSDATAWARSHLESVNDFATTIAPALWEEAIEFSEMVQSRERDEALAIRGGGAHYPLLFFLTRLLEPEFVLETGVAAGYSSWAFLEAIRRNGKGRLASSDFPYFRLDEPETAIGAIVPDDLRQGWRLETKGDDVNIPVLIDGVEHIDLFHYDSDKTYAGRRRAIARVEPLLASGSAFLMDDIGDDFFFRDHVAERGCDFRVFDFHGYQLGLIGL